MTANVCNNLPQAILGAGVGCYWMSHYSDFGRYMMEGDKIMRDAFPR